MSTSEPIRRVLLVDDSPHDRALVTRELRNALSPDLEIVEARDADELNRALSAEPFELVITDYRLRWTTGLDVLQQVKARYPYTAVVMFTATGTEEIAVEAMKTGLDDYVIKNPKHMVRLRSAALAAVQRMRQKRRSDQLEIRLNLLLQRLSVGVFRCDSVGRLLDTSDAVRRLLGVAGPPEASGSGGESVAEVQRRFERLLAQPEVREAMRRAGLQGVSEAETRVAFLPDRPPMWLRIVITPADGPEGRVFEGLVEDVTERKEAERQLQRQAAARERCARLAPREREVLRQVVAGVPNKAIARILGISEKTVEKYRASLIRKLGVRTTAEAVRIAAEAGLHE
ncbi:MAG: DNA-binding response regulator [Planctomycetota bacterium]|nr:MAG: DNA-binding response regulator [Planctomycetota bacterium]